MSSDSASISKGRSYKEIGEYWDDHDASEVWDRGAPVDFEVDIKSQKRYYPLERGLSERVNEIARARGVSPETLINLWIQEKVGTSPL